MAPEYMWNPRIYMKVHGKKFVKQTMLILLWLG
jgi:hypothetical protein